MHEEKEESELDYWQRSGLFVAWPDRFCNVWQRRNAASYCIRCRRVLYGQYIMRTGAENNDALPR